jgi:tetratricopeptide (TPR) repeat protein
VRALEAAGNLFYHTGDTERPRKMYQAQLELATALDDEKGIADARYNLLFTDYGPSDFEAALIELDAIEAQYVALGDDRMVARTMWARGGQLMAGGRAPEAVQILERAIVRYRELGDFPYLGQTAGLLSAASFQLGDPASGARWLLEAATLAFELGNLPAVTVGLPSMAISVFHLGLADAAATILGAYDGLARRYGVRMPKNLEQYLEAVDPLSQVKAALDADSYVSAFRRGAEMTLDEVVGYVVELASRQGVAAAPT